MTDTTAPVSPGIVHALAERTVAAFLAHWDKLLNLTLGAIVTYAGMWVAGQLSRQPPPAPAPAPKVVEIVKTVPDTSATAQRVRAIEWELNAFRQEFADFAKSKGKRKAVSQPIK